MCHFASSLSHRVSTPLGRPRTLNRVTSRFRAIAFGRARDDVFGELRRFDAADVVMSTNVPLTIHGLPYASYRQPDDPGVAVYFSLRPIGTTAPRRYYAIACDHYRKIEENLRAVATTIEAMRTIARHGAMQLLEQAMSGFTAIPEAADPTKWWVVLGFGSRPTLEAAEDRWKSLVKEHHPDLGGSTSRMVEINMAIAAARKDLGRS